jgi:hypothetical protein
MLIFRPTVKFELPDPSQMTINGDSENEEFDNNGENL